MINVQTIIDPIDLNNDIKDNLTNAIIVRIII